MSAKGSHQMYKRGGTYAFLLCLFLFGCGTAFAEPTRPDTSAKAVHRFLKETFPEFRYHGAYLEEENGYLVVSLKIRPGEISRSLEEAQAGIDEILARRVIQGLYKKRFSLYLLGFPQIRGVSVIVTWEGCQRIMDPEKDKEEILLSEGISEFDRFDLSRTLYFEKFALAEMAQDPVSAGRLFDRIEFSHLKGNAYRQEYLHTISNSP